jgi:hypothetical protein
MMIRVPDMLNVNNAESYHVSIRLWPDGLSFSGYILTERDSFFTETVAFDKRVPLVESLKEIFFNNECLSYIYRSLYVIAVSRKYTLVPDSVFIEKNKELLFSFCFQTDESSRVLSQPLKPFGSFLLYSMDNEVYEFMMRSLVNPRFIHFLSPMLSEWRKQSVACYPKQLYVVIHDEMLDIVCFAQGEMLFVNSFCYETESDIVYFMMYVCKQLSLNQLEDYVSFCGDKMMCRKIVSVVKNYIAHVDIVSPKIKQYQVEFDRDVPVDVITLIECGL